MKKIITIILIILCTGCFAKKQDNFDNIIKQLDTTSTSKLDIEETFDNFERNILYEDLKDIKDEVLEFVDENNLKKYYLKKLDKEDLTIIMVMTVKDDKKDLVKKEIDSYFEQEYEKENSKNQNIIKERIEYEYDDYLIFIASNNKKEILNDILSTKEKLFENTISLDDEAIKEKFNINTKKLKKYKFKISSNLENINDYIIIKNEDLEELQEKIDTYYNKLASEVADKEKEKILKRMTKEIDDYLIVIVTDNNEEIWKIIEKNL